MVIVWRIRGKIIRTLCALLCMTVVYSDMHTHTHTHEQFLKLSVGFRFRFRFCVCLVLAFCMFFCFSLDYFVLVLSAFVVLGLVSSVLC